MPNHDKLSATKVAKLRTPGRYGDGLGLWLQITHWKTKSNKTNVNKSWLFQYTALNGKVRQLGLGALHTLSLAEARQRARAARQLVLDGVDPIDARRAQRESARLEQARRVTFQQCADQYIASHQSAWRNAKHREQWTVTLRSYVHPIIGALAVAEIDTSLVLKVLQPIWEAKTETAVRVRGRIESVLDWAKVRGHRQGENPARWRGHLDKLLPAPTKIRQIEHHPALPYTELPEFMIELRRREGLGARALEFTTLTAARTNEVIGAKWNEIDFVTKVWTVPATRMKAGREHRVPLSDWAIATLQSLPREHGSEFVFIGTKEGAALSSLAMLQTLREMRPGALTVHGLRSTFRDWAAERTAFANHVVEMALAHSISVKVEASYRRGDLIDKRRRLMDAWAKYCSTGTRKTGQVLPMRVMESGA